MKTREILIVFIVFFLSYSYTNAQEMDSACTMFDCCRPDGHAPLGIMTDHIHGKGEWTISYSYMNMQMKGNQVGESKVSDSQVFSNYIMSSNTMSMQTHMLMGMYGVSDRLTIMGMFSYMLNSMTMNMTPSMTAMMNMPGMNMGNMSEQSMQDMQHSKTSGLGDTRIYGLYKIMDKKRQRIIAGLGINLPTGSIHENGTTLLGPEQRLPYMMQLGSGTYDLLPNITYVGQKAAISWGAYAGANIKTMNNGEGYHWGNEYNASAWIGYKFLPFASASVRVEGIYTDAIMGYDPHIVILMNNDPNSNTNNYGGEKMNVYLGLNLYKYKSELKGARLQIEYGMPFYQNLNGPQMSAKSTVMAGVQYIF